MGYASPSITAWLILSYRLQGVRTVWYWKKKIACLFSLNDAYICWMILKKWFYTLKLNLKSVTERAWAELLAVEFISEGMTPLCLPLPAPLNLNGAASAPACRVTYRAVFCKPRETQGSKRILCLSKTYLPVTVISRVENSSFFLFKPISFTERTKKDQDFCFFWSCPQSKIWPSASQLEHLKNFSHWC